MKAKIGSYIDSAPMWIIEAEPCDSVRGRYQVFQGIYSVARYSANGLARQTSIMHSRYSALRTKIDAAIAAAK